MSRRRLPSRSILERSSRAVDTYVCPNCIHRRKIQAQTRNVHNIQQRSASTVTSATAINAPSEAPPEYKSLIAALDLVRKNASNYVNLSRLQLAIRGLESGRDATIRIAILGVNGTRRARQVARLLLADPLVNAEEWERSLQDSVRGDQAQSTLLTYGNTENNVTTPSDRLLPHRPVPSRILHKHRVEVLISSLNIGNGTTASPVEESERVEEVILAPALDTPTSASGRMTQITYPVHKAMIVGDGIDSLIGLSQYLSAFAPGTSEKSLLKSALNFPGATNNPATRSSASVACIDVDLASQALDSFRESIQNATNYERGWLKSGLPLLSDWFTQGISACQSNAPKGAVTVLVHSLLKAARQRMRAENTARLLDRQITSTTMMTRASISEATTSWAEGAHTELRDQLDMAFEGKHWRRFAWYKLLWRVDDVSMLTTEVLERRWLPEAEKGVIYLAGRMEEAGLLESSATPDESPTTSYSNALVEPEVDENPIFLSEPPMSTLGELQAADTKPTEDTAITPPTSKPWPMTIPYARHTLLTTMVPRLQSLAQKLVLQTLSTSALSLAIAGAAYTAVSTTTVYEAGAVAAFGIVFSLRKLQKDWESAREACEAELREEGRTALKETEEIIRRKIRDGGRVGIDELEKDREVASRAIEGAERALEKLVGPKGGDKDSL